MSKKKTTSPWLEADEIKRRVSIEDVLSHFGVIERLRRQATALVGPSPFRDDDANPSFRADTEKNIWNDFGGMEGYKGNVIGMWMRFQGIPPTGEGFRQALLEMHEEFIAEQEEQADEGRGEVAEALRKEETEQEKVNTPFGQELKGLRHDAKYLADKGISAKTAKVFGVGYCSRGYLKGRIAFPVKNREGVIVAYTGRAVKDDDPRGKWRNPPGFHRSLELFGIDRVATVSEVKKAVRDFGLIVVGGPSDVLKLAQEGFPNLVATMGAEVSDEQVAMMLDAELNPTRRITILFDRDEAGERGRRELAGKLIRQGFVRYAAWERAPEGLTDPDDLDVGQLRAVLGHRDS